MSPTADASDTRQQDARLIWYAAYGSNMLTARLGYYLSGGQPPGSARHYPGARDPRPPAGSRPIRLDGGVYFAGQSSVWGGGMALYDPGLPGTTAARAYLLTREQFSDIAEQEMHRRPGRDLDLAEVLAAGRARLGPGRYETLLRTGPDLDGLPVLTFTAPWRADQTSWNAPTVRYLSLLAAGLREAHGWSAARTVSYLRRLPGVRHDGLPAMVSHVYADD